MKLVRSVTNQDGTHAGWLAWCEPCNTHKLFDQRWTFDGNEEAPTFSPSMLLRYNFAEGTPMHAEHGPNYVCHSFLRAGVWEYLNDCTHKLAGQRVPLSLPKWEITDAQARSGENGRGATLVVIPRAKVPMGGPSLPAPEWFQDSEGIPWLRCGGCGDLLNLHQLVDSEGVCEFGVTHPQCGASVAPFTLEGWRK